MLRQITLTCVMLASILPLTAHAHSDADWMHGMTDGAWFFFTSAQYALLVLVAGLPNFRGTQMRIYHAVLLFTAGLLAGTSCYFAGVDASSLDTLAPAYIISLGLLVLIDLNLPSVVLACLYLVSGTLVGLGLLTDIADEAAKVAIATSFLLLTMALFTASTLASRFSPGGWQRISVRVVASWSAAIASISLVVIVMGLETTA